MWVHVIFVTVLLQACAGTVIDLGEDGGPADAAVDGAIDARPVAADAVLAADGPPGTLGWIGSRCSGPADCPFAGGMCLTEGFPGGLCTKECPLTCPDKPGTPLRELHPPRDRGVVQLPDARQRRDRPREQPLFLRARGVPAGVPRRH